MPTDRESPAGAAPRASRTVFHIDDDIVVTRIEAAK